MSSSLPPPGKDACDGCGRRPAALAGYGLYDAAARRHLIYRLCADLPCPSRGRPACMALLNRRLECAFESAARNEAGRNEDPAREAAA